MKDRLHISVIPRDEIPFTHLYMGVIGPLFEKAEFNYCLCLINSCTRFRLRQISDELDHIKGEMEERGTTMSDGGKREIYITAQQKIMNTDNGTCRSVLIAVKENRLLKNNMLSKKCV